MTSADFLRFVIIVVLGVLAFISFLVAGTMIGLMFLDSWSCGECKLYPVGLYILGLLGILFLIQIGNEIAEAQEPWVKWFRGNVNLLVISALILITLLFVLNPGWWL